MNDKQKIKRLQEILSCAIGELYEGASDEYAEEVLDLIDTNEEELKELGVNI